MSKANLSTTENYFKYAMYVKEYRDMREVFDDHMDVFWAAFCVLDDQGYFDEEIEKWSRF